MLTIFGVMLAAAHVIALKIMHSYKIYLWFYLFTKYSILQAAQKPFTEYKCANIVLDHFNSVLNLSINQDPQLSNKDTIEGFQVDLLVKLLYCVEIIHGLNSLFRALPK